MTIFCRKNSKNGIDIVLNSLIKQIALMQNNDNSGNDNNGNNYKKNIVAFKIIIWTVLDSVWLFIRKAYLCCCRLCK